MSQNNLWAPWRISYLKELGAKEASGNAVFFDGTDDYIHIADNSSFDFGTGDFSIFAWVRTDSVGHQMILAKEGTDPRFYLRLNVGRVHGLIDDGTTTVAALSDNPINNDIWQWPCDIPCRKDFIGKDMIL